MKKKEYTGYSVVTEDMTTALFWSGNFDACKQSCHKGNVVVREYRKKQVTTFGLHGISGTNHLLLGSKDKR